MVCWVQNCMESFCGGGESSSYVVVCSQERVDKASGITQLLSPSVPAEVNTD